MVRIEVWTKNLVRMDVWTNFFFDVGNLGIGHFDDWKFGREKMGRMEVWTDFLGKRKLGRYFLDEWKLGRVKIGRMEVRTSKNWTNGSFDE